MGTRTRRGVAALTGLLLALVCIGGSVQPAEAGGPTSVIMVNPGTGQAAALHTSDRRYQRLVDAVHAYHTPTKSTDQPRGVPDCGGCEIRLTWLIHDMSIWRIDRVHLTPDDGVWLQSVSDETGTRDLFDQPSIWQRPHDAAALLVLLTDAGVGSTADRGNADAAAPAMAAGDVRSGSTDVAPVVALICGMAGLGVGLIGGMLIRRRRSAPDRAVLTG